jgi:CheY-like chemotaxis protein
MPNIQVVTQAEPVAPRGDLAAQTVLLADDDEDFRSALAELLAEEGFRVLEVPSGEAALAFLDRIPKARGRGPDLLVLDLMMPKLSGIEVLQRLRKSPRWALLPVLVITGVNDPMLRVRLDLPIAFKPDTDAVVETVRRLLPSRSRPDDRSGRADMRDAG